MLIVTDCLLQVNKDTVKTENSQRIFLVVDNSANLFSKGLNKLKMSAHHRAKQKS